MFSLSFPLGRVRPNLTRVDHNVVVNHILLARDGIVPEQFRLDGFPPFVDPVFLLDAKPRFRGLVDPVRYLPDASLLFQGRQEEPLYLGLDRCKHLWYAARKLVVAPSVEHPEPSQITGPTPLVDPAEQLRGNHPLDAIHVAPEPCPPGLLDVEWNASVGIAVEKALVCSTEGIFGRWMEADEDDVVLEVDVEDGAFDFGDNGALVVEGARQSYRWR